MSEIEEVSNETTQEWAENLALHDLLVAATDFFGVRPDLRGLTIENQDDGVWVLLPDGTKHALDLEEIG